MRRAVLVAAALQRGGFDVRAIRPPSVPAGTARLRISVNEDPKVDLELTQTGQVSCDVEAALAPGAICKLTIEIDRTFMPSQFGFPEDNRVLGIFVRSVRCVSESQSGESYSGLRLASS